MAGDWIKMRSGLFTNPKVTAICKLLENSKLVGKKLSTGFGGPLREIVTRNVTRDVTVASLFRVWCAANEHTKDGVWYGIELDDLDHVAGIDGFGDMMKAVGWAVYDSENQTVTFPNFLEYNAPAKDGRVSSAAERQRRYREKSRSLPTSRDVTRNVTENVTRDVEKRREEYIEEEREKAPPSPTLEVIELWNKTFSQKCDLTQSRTRALGARMKSPKWAASWKEAIDRASKSRFCRGENDRGWKADLDWFLKPDTVTKILEGKYDNRVPESKEPSLYDEYPEL